MNNTPVIKNGDITINEAGFPENDLKRIPAARKARMKSTPPISSLFHAIIKIAVKTIKGILCIRKPSNFLPRGWFSLNTSNENISINRIAKLLKSSESSKVTFLS